jgi:hypothetical protein
MMSFAERINMIRILRDEICDYEVTSKYMYAEEHKQICYESIYFKTRDIEKLSTSSNAIEDRLRPGRYHVCFRVEKFFEDYMFNALQINEDIARYEKALLYMRLEDERCRRGFTQNIINLKQDLDRYHKMNTVMNIDHKFVNTQPFLDIEHMSKEPTVADTLQYHNTAKIDTAYMEMVNQNMPKDNNLYN